MARRIPIEKTARPRVIVFVRGGVAEVCADNTAEVIVIDYDNEPNAKIPSRFSDLMAKYD